MSSFRGQVQGFAVGAAVIAALTVGLPALIAPKPAAVPTSPNAAMDELAAQFAVEIVWSHANICEEEAPGAYGCFDPTTPDQISVSPTLSPYMTRYTVLHEIGHVVQFRLGLPLDQCGADQFARSLGTIQGMYCLVD